MALDRARPVGGPALLIFTITLLLLFCATSFTATATASAISGDDGHVVEGRVKVEVMRGKGFSKTANIKVIINAGEQVSFIRTDGSFSFEGVPGGTYLLEVAALGYFFPMVRVDVSSRLPGEIRASYIEGPRRISGSLVLEPLREENYYEIREPFSLMGLLKSPMGLMIGFMVICVFLLPMLMDSIDPEEMKRLQETQRANPSPISQFIQSRS
ncbi:hypothetical protein M758_1G086800 [Ceratodon purpureus]|nr:hypothetical protein M758_1G086800 [Ceratodon purpureus]